MSIFVVAPSRLFWSAVLLNIHAQVRREWAQREVRLTDELRRVYSGRPFWMILCQARASSSPLTNFKSTLRTLRTLKVRNSYLHNSQGQKLTLIMDYDLKIVFLRDL